jgi:hypothetical protein
MLKKIIILFLLFYFPFPAFLSAQHNKAQLLQPTCASHNLRDNPRQMVVVQRYQSGNDNNFQETYLFDSLGKLTEYRKRGFGGEKVTAYPLTLEALSVNRQYKFDYDGDVLELRQFDLRGRLIATTHCIYGRGGNLVQSVEYTYHADSGAVVKRTVSDYDKKERLKTVRQYTSDELLLWEEHRQYDRRGNLIKRTQTFYNGNEKETTVEKRSYSFDSHGNWILCRYSLNGTPMYSISRSLTYY